MSVLFYQVLCTDRFHHQAVVLPQKIRSQVWDGIHKDLATNPLPDGDHKKILRNASRVGKLYRYRVGEFRVLYTIGDPTGCVVLQAVVKRDEKTYRDLADRIDAVVVEGDNVAAPPVADLAPKPSHRPTRRPTGPVEEPRPLPRLLTQDEFQMLGVPNAAIHHLLTCKDEESLINSQRHRPSITNDMLDRIIDVVYGADIDVRPFRPTYELPADPELPSFLTGTLPALMLHLDEEQRRHAEWPANGSGPSLLKGSPGTGKSAVAAYRVKSLVQVLKTQPGSKPRILVTTYTNSPVSSLKTLLATLLGNDMAHVKVATTDTVVGGILTAAGQLYAPRTEGVARAAVQCGRTRLRQHDPNGEAFAESIKRLSLDYLTEEIEQFIVARDVANEEAYLRANRAGRKVPLSQTQRKAIWHVFLDYKAYLQEKNLRTFAQTRRDAMHLVEDGLDLHSYDAVVIDEAQDLDPTEIRMLVALCKSLDRLFLTADAAQQVYGSGFAWKEVHDDLRLRGRVGTLVNCYRSTRQIGAAAEAWFRDPDRGKLAYQRSGPLPLCRTVTAHGDAAQAIGAFLRATSLAFRIPFGSCAVLTPTNQTCETVARLLHAAGIPTRLAPDLNSPNVKVLTYHAAKGLEFPVVAIYDFVPTGAAVHSDLQEERDERADLGRRVRYVAMTRAMQALAFFALAPDGQLPDGLGGPEWEPGWPTDLEAWAKGAPELAATIG